MKNLRIKVVGKATMVAMLIGAYHLGAQSSALPASAPQGVHEEHQTGQGFTFHGDVALCVAPRELATALQASSVV